MYKKKLVWLIIELNNCNTFKFLLSENVLCLYRRLNSSKCNKIKTNVFLCSHCWPTCLAARRQLWTSWACSLCPRSTLSSVRDHHRFWITCWLVAVLPSAEHPIYQGLTPVLAGDLCRYVYQHMYNKKSWPKSIW